MARAGKEDPELNMLVGRPDPRVRRRSFLQVAGLLAAAGVAGYAGGTVAGRGYDDPPGAVAAADGQPIAGNRRNERLLNIYNWSDYIDDRTIPLFQAQANIRVNYDVFSSNEDLLARMRAGPTSYDIIVPTNQYIPTYLKLDLIEPLRQDLIPNLTNLDREFVETDYDQGNRYTVPWQWGTTGIGFNRAKVPRGQARLLGVGVRARRGRRGPGDPAARGHRPDRLRAHLRRQEPQLHRGRRPGRGRQAGPVGPGEAEGVHHRHLHRRAGRQRDLGRPGLERRRVPGPGPEPGRQLRHPQGRVAALRRRHGHPQGRPPSRQRRPLHELRPPPQGPGPHLQVRQLRHAGVAGQAAVALGPDREPVDLPAGLDQAVDRHPDRPEALQVAGGVRPDRQVAFPYEGRQADRLRDPDREPRGRLAP